MRTPHISALALSTLLFAAACGDITSGAPAVPGAEAAARPKVSKLLGTVTCYVDVAAETHRCGAPVSRAGGPNETRVILSSAHFTLNTGPSFTSGGLAYIWTTIQNDIGQNIGTHNGIQSDSIRAFVSAINVTGGSGVVTAYNHTGTGTFTASNQPYWEWYEIVNAGGGESTNLLWQFSVPGTVTAWNYTVGVSAPIANPDGWVSVSGDVAIPNGGSRTHTAVVYDWIGNVVTGGYALWSRTNVSGSVTFTTINSRQATFTGTSVGSVEITAFHGFATEREYGANVF